MTLAEAACSAKPGILERSFPWCLSGRGYCMLPNSSMSQRRHIALCVCRLRTQATILSKTNHYAKPLRIRMDITSTFFHMLLLLQLFPHMPQPWMCDPCTAPWCYTQTASYLRHTCRAYASTRAEESVIVFYAWSLDLLMRIFP